MWLPSCKIDNTIVNFDTKLKTDCTINFVDSNDLAGYKMYQAGLKFVFLASMYDIYGKKVDISFDHSIMRGMHITINDLKITNKEIIKIKERMAKIISSNLRIVKMNVLSKEMVEFYKKEGKVLVMDNPFAQTNAAHLLKPLIDMAKKTDTQLICLSGLGGDSIYSRFDNIYVLNLVTAGLRGGMQYLRGEHTRGIEEEVMVTSQIEVIGQQSLLF